MLWSCEVVGEGRLCRCVRCPTAYHASYACLAAGSQLLSGTAMICSRHVVPSRVHSHISTTWCITCDKGVTRCPLIAYLWLWVTLLVGRQEGHPACKKYGGWWRWALVSPDRVVPSRMVGLWASVNLRCTMKSRSSLLAPAHPGGPGKGP